MSVATEHPAPASCAAVTAEQERFRVMVREAVVGRLGEPRTRQGEDDIAWVSAAVGGELYSLYTRELAEERRRLQSLMDRLQAREDVLGEGRARLISERETWEAERREQEARPVAGGPGPAWHAAVQDGIAWYFEAPLRAAVAMLAAVAALAVPILCGIAEMLR